jgi:murein DD-endopeptidase MepM/ murein hydrolase activator NlpD
MGAIQTRPAAALSIAICLLFGLALIAPPRAGAAVAAQPERGEQTFTPVIQDVVSTPRWFRGVDGLVHVVYDLRLINGFPVNATIQSIEVRRGGGGVLAELTGDTLREAISPVGSPSTNEATLPPSSAAFAFMDLTVTDLARLPKRLVHTTSVEIEPGLPVPSTSVNTGARARVHQGPPVRIAPPLAGPRWTTIVGAHRRSLQPVNGRFVNGQRFAIDWNRLDDQYRPAFGDPATFASNPSYGAPLLAVANGKVVEAVDGIPDQPPDAFEPVGPEIADGNVVILRLAPSVFAGYAHLVPGSVRVEVGDRVRTGAVLGALGNSGNSNGPHLHFQLMNEPSLLASTGLPLEFRRFRLTGVIPSMDAFGEAFATQTPVPFVTEGAGVYGNRTPVGIDILDLP